MAKYRLPREEYWAKRQTQMFAQIEKEEETLVKRMNKKYREISADVSRQIESYFAKYGRDNVIEYADMFQSLDDHDRDLLFRDMDSFARKYPQYADLMPVRESIYKLNRLQGLQTSVDLQLLEMGAMEHEEFNRHYNRQVNYVYGETSRILTGGQVFNLVDPQITQIVAGRNWTQAGNYSDDIWSSKSNLMEAIHRDLTNGLIRGDSYQDITRAMKTRLVDQQTNNIMRLVRTEGTYIANETMARTAMGQMDYEEYEYSAVDDSRTSAICRSLDGKRFKFADREPGVNFPPMHPHCRSSFTIVIPNEWDNWTPEEIDALRHEPGWTDKEVDELLKQQGYSKPVDKRRSISHSSKNYNRRDIEKKIKDGHLDGEKFYLTKAKFDNAFRKGLKTPVETVYNYRDSYYHIVNGHEDMMDDNEINNIVNTLEAPGKVMVTKDKKGIPANGYLKTTNEGKLLVIVRDGIITSYYPDKKYLKNLEEKGVLIYDSKNDAL